MKKEYLSVNTNKLHDELIASRIIPLLVESIEDKTSITFHADTDMDLVQQIIDAHDPTPLPPQLTEIEILKMEQAKANAEMINLMMSMLGGAM